MYLNLPTNKDKITFRESGQLRNYTREEAPSWSWTNTVILREDSGTWTPCKTVSRWMRRIFETSSWDVSSIIVSQVKGVEGQSWRNCFSCWELLPKMVASESPLDVIHKFAKLKKMTTEDTLQNTENSCKIYPCVTIFPVAKATLQLQMSISLSVR